MMTTGNDNTSIVTQWNACPANKLWAIISATKSFDGHSIGVLDVANSLESQLDEMLNTLKIIEYEIRNAALRHDDSAFVDEYTCVADKIERSLVIAKPAQ